MVAKLFLHICLHLYVTRRRVGLAGLPIALDHKPQIRKLSHATFRRMPTSMLPVLFCIESNVRAIIGGCSFDRKKIEYPAPVGTAYIVSVDRRSTLVGSSRLATRLFMCSKSTNVTESATDRTTSILLFGSRRSYCSQPTKASSNPALRSPSFKKAVDRF